MKLFVAAAGLLALVATTGVEAFAPVVSRRSMTTTTTTSTTTFNNSNREEPSFTTTTALFSESNSNNQKKGGLDGNLRSKLVSESIAPWRAVRLFLYFALGSGAFLGGLINGSGAIAGSASPEFNLNTEVCIYDVRYITSAVCLMIRFRLTD